MAKYLVIWQKQAKMELLCSYFNFFSVCGKLSLKTNVLGPFRESCGNGPGTLKFCSDILNSWDFGGAQTKYLYMYNLDIRIIEKNWVLFSQKKQFFFKISIFQVHFHDIMLHLEKNWSTLFACFCYYYYYLAIASGARNKMVWQ